MTSTAPTGASAALTANALTVRYGLIQAVRGIDLQVPSGKAVALVGHNGAGKSSVLSAIGGCLPHGARQQGKIVAAGRVALVPEREKVFRLLSTEDNLKVAQRGQRAGQGITRDDIYAYFPSLALRRRSLAGNLSGGEQQMLAIGMALLEQPSLLLLDEPTLGLSVPVIEGLCQKLATLRDALHLSILVAESDATWVPWLAEHAVVLDRGEVVGREDVKADAGSRDRLDQWLLRGALDEPSGATLAGDDVVEAAA